MAVMYMSIPDYCKHTGFTDKFIRRMIASGNFPAFKERGKKWWINVRKADAYFEQASEPNRVVLASVNINVNEEEAPVYNKQKAQIDSRIAALKKKLMDKIKEEHQ